MASNQTQCGCWINVRQTMQQDFRVQLNFSKERMMSSDMSRMISEAMDSSVNIIQACTWDRGTNAEPRPRSSNGHCSTWFRINTRCLSHVCHHVSSRVIKRLKTKTFASVQNHDQSFFKTSISNDVGLL